MSLAFIAICPLHAALLAGMHRIGFAEPWDERAMADLLAMPGAFGFLAAAGGGDATANTPPRGFILCRIAADEAEVLTLLVLPPYRRAWFGAPAARAGDGEGTPRRRK